MTPHSRIVGTALLLLALMAGAANTAWAYWTSTGNGTGLASTATLNPATDVTATNTLGEADVDVAWTAPTVGLIPEGYYVTRVKTGNGSTADACGSSPFALVAGPCTDSLLPSGNYHYTVTAVYRSWTAASADSNSVSVGSDTTAPLVAVTTVNGSVRTFPFSTRSRVTSIGGTCGTAPGDSVTISPLIDGAPTDPAATSCTSGSWELILSSRLSGNGTWTLSATQDDAAGNTGIAPEQTLSIDRTRPTLSSIERAGSSESVNAGPLSWTVVFSEPVLGVSTSNFGLAMSGLAGTPTLSSTEAVGGAPSTTWTVIADLDGVTGTDAGSIGLDLTGRGSITDPASNRLQTSSFTGATYTYDTSPPSVSSIERTEASQLVKSGPLSWMVTFSEPVSGVVVSNFVLATSGLGGTAPTVGAVTASGGSPSATWTVTTSMAGTTGTNNGSVGLNLVGAGSITDVATNPVSPTSFTGQVYSFDTTAPVVTGVSSPLADGSYKAGQVVPITLTFSEPVTVTGTPRLTLSTTTPTTTAVDYSTGSGTNTLTFNYQVVAGNSSADLDYASLTALALNGGSIADAATNAAALTLAVPGAPGSLGANKALVIDTTAPLVTVTRVNGSVRGFPYTSNANVSSIGGSCGTAPGDVNTVRPLINGSGTTPASTTCLSGSWTLTLDAPLASDGTWTLSATQEDAAGNTGTAANRTLTIDKTPPSVSSIVRMGAVQLVKSGPLSWMVTFSEPVSGVVVSNFVLATSGLGGTAPTVGAVTASGGSPSATWTVTTSMAGTTGTNNGSVGLNLVGAGSITDVATNPVSPTSFTGQVYSFDTTAPVVTGVSSPLADGSYKAGQVVPITLTFSEPVTVTGTPRLTLSTTTPTTTAVDYSTGSGTNTLTFNYQVVAGNSSADLDYASLTALALNGGSIADAATNAAALTLAVPGAPGSLGANKALVIDTTAPLVTVTELRRQTAGINNRVRVAGTAQDADGPVTLYLCVNVASPCAANTATQTVTNITVSGGAWTSGWIDGNGTGTWFAVATQTDAALNTGQSAVFGPLVD